MKKIGLALAGAALAGWLFAWLGVPVAWLLGPMCAGILWGSLRWGPRSLPDGYMATGQAIIGIATGISFPLSALQTAAHYALPLLLAVLITGGLSLLNGYLLYRWGGIDRATGFLGSLPGAAATMVAMSEEMGADPVSVAVLQYLRLLLVLFLAPLAVHAFFPQGAGGAAAVPLAHAMPDLPVLAAGLLILAGCGLLGAWLGQRVHLPSPTFLGPMLVALLAAWFLPLPLWLPPVVQSVGLLCVGLAIGLRFDLVSARKLGKVALLETALVVALIGICLLVGWGFHVWTGVAPMTAALGSTPGGMDVMVASAAQLHADPALVLAMQLARWLIILLVGPWVTVQLGSAGRLRAEKSRGEQ